MTICDDCIHKNVCADEGHYDEGLSFCADKIEVRTTEVNCSNCDYFKFSQSFIENVVRVMTDVADHAYDRGYADGFKAGREVTNEDV